MNRSIAVLALFAVSVLAPLAFAQTTRVMTLSEAVRMALQQNPDVLLARVESQKAERAEAVARGWLSPVGVVGSGLGWTDGIPQSVEGATPSVVQATGQMPIYDQTKRKRVQEAAALSRAARHTASAREDEIAYEVAVTYLDFERAARVLDLLRERLMQYDRLEDMVRAQVEEGRAIPLERSRARLEKARAEQALTNLQRQARLLEATLRSQLGLNGEVRLVPGAPEKLPVELPATADLSAERAVATSPALKSLAATVEAREHGVAAEQGARYPKLDLVAQYSLLARFNNYDEFFNRFQRHNGQVGMSFQLRLYAGRSVSASVARAQTEAREAQLRLEASRADVELESLRLFQDVEQAEAAQKLAKLELDYVRESLDVLLAQFEEGRIALDEVERRRTEESLAWESYYDAQYALRRAKLNLLRRTGELAAALR